MVEDKNSNDINEMIGKLIPGIVHELNNPLSLIKSNVSSLENYFTQLFEYISSIDDFINNEPGSELLSLKTKIDQLKEQKDITFINNDSMDIFVECNEAFEKIKQITNNLLKCVHNENNETLIDLDQTLKNILLLLNNEIKYKAKVNYELTNPPLFVCNQGIFNEILFHIILAAKQIIGYVNSTDEIGLLIVKSSYQNKKIICDIIIQTLASMLSEEEILKIIRENLIKEYNLVFDMNKLTKKLLEYCMGSIFLIYQHKTGFVFRIEILLNEIE